MSSGIGSRRTRFLDPHARGSKILRRGCVIAGHSTRKMVPSTRVNISSISLLTANAGIHHSLQTVERL